MSTPAAPQPTQYAPSSASPAKFGGLAWTSLILGIVGLVFSLVPILDVITMLAAIVGIILGVIGLFGSRKTLAGIGAGLCVLAVIATVAVMNSVTTAVDKGLQNIGHNPAAMGDLAVSDCSVTNDYGTALSHATVKITNMTGKMQSYMATISVNNASGARIGEINVVSNSLAAGQSVTLTGMNASGSAVNGAKPGPATCVIANVNRFPS
jgi:hypothetical protein